MIESGRPPVEAMTNPRADRVRDVAKLVGRSGRLKRRQFLAEGPQSVREALKAHSECLAAGGSPVVEALYATVECLKRYPELLEAASTPGTRLQVRIASEMVLSAMTDTVTPQGVVAVCNFVDVPLDAVLASKPKLIAMLCQVRDPGNAGTVLRAADAAGADAVIFSHSSVDIYNPKAVRATAGSLFHLPVVLGADVAEVVAAAKAAGVGVLAADGYGHLNLDLLQDESAARAFDQQIPDSSYALEDPTLWLFGNEAQGLAGEEKALADHRVAVPVYGEAESLNLGTAATVCLYASARAQRRAG
ncbi:TrmH family RNA methyltransferase [Arthrobacter glacialis]|uniref:RNA methyltransferase n=1 Tax=Arthrobacter glacialis TaxID=1664 RepID=A0A2S3ZUX2_ARTGL|nr:RNA methyltransferase [Arthrobacter glacialis]POH58018.1 RNA methyltransferase [Arthrobacter glacialis]POH72762.1 RNA methyltransferase [Arthrobacter glacialis]